MQQLQAPTNTDNERAQLRLLIEQQTKEFEAKNGPVITLDIVRKEQVNYYAINKFGSTIISVETQMNTRGLLDQLLSSGKELLQGQHTAQSNQAGQAAPSEANTALNGLLGSIGGGALGGGLISLLMSSKKARKVGGNVITYGGLAALGVVAYKAYSNWQNNNQNRGQVQSSAPSTQYQPQTVDRVSSAVMEEHSQAILRAIICAAKADGHIDEREQQLIDDAIAKLTNEPQLQSWFQQEVRKPLDPADLARAAKTPEIAAEMYLASILVVDEESYMERAYLDELARQLQLAPALKSELEAQAVAHMR